MDYGQSDSSGTEDDYPASHQAQSQREGYVNGNKQTVGNDTLQNDIESQIRRLEQEAYCSVLRAFKAQSDAITWEKEGVITDLRKELGVSDEEHRRFLSKVNVEDTIRTIREWRQAGGIHNGLLNNAHSKHDATTSPSSSRKRSRTSQAMPSISLGVSAPALDTQAVTAPVQPSLSVAKQGTVAGAKSKKTKPCPSSGTNGRGLVAPRSSSAVPTATRPFQHTGNESLIGRKVMTRWPEDNSFYEAVIAAYNAKEGLHSLIYDMNTENETWEWVNLKEIAAEDICWVDELDAPNQGGLNGPRSTKKSQQASGAINDAGRRNGTSKTPSKKNYIPSQNGHMSSAEDFEILHTETLLKEVESIFAASHSDPLEIEKAKKMLREQEQSLIDALARLGDISDGESEGDDQFLHVQSREGGWPMNHKHSGKQQGANYDVEGQEGSDDEQTV